MECFKRFCNNLLSFWKEEDVVEQPTLSADTGLIERPHDEEGPVDIQKTNQEETTHAQKNEHIGDFNKLLANTIDTIKYYDQTASQIDNTEVKILLDDVCRKLIENLILSGCKAINEPNGIFDITKHKVVPFQIVPEGTAYMNLIRPGVEYNGEVKILAIVEL